MDKLKDAFKNQGGMQLVKKYLRAGVLSYAILQLFLTGESRKALELLRLGTQLKVYQKVRKKYWKTLKDFDANYKETTQGQEPVQRRVWICWMQGIENAPVLVQKCFASIKEHIIDRDIVLITADNRKEYVELPEYIEEKYAKGIITHTHFSDILRVALLAKYGGTWIDATVFCSGGVIPHYMLDSDFFVFQNLKPGVDGHVLNISSWFITAKASNKIVTAVRELLYEYWKKNDSLIEYFLIHIFFIMTNEMYVKEWKKVIPFSNSTPHIFLLRLFDPFNAECFEELKRICPFHKLAYKRDAKNFVLKRTYYDVIFNT